MSSLGMRLVGRLSLTHSKPDAYRRHADQEDDGREQASDSALPVSRETGPAPRKRRPYRSRQSGGARCHDRTCRASLTDGTRSAPPKADASATFFRGSSPWYPAEHDVLNGKPLPGTGRRYQVAPHVRRRTPYLPPRRETASRLISNLESRLLRSVTSAESHGALPLDASPLVSRETDSQTRRGRHGSADVIPRSALPG